MSELFCYFEKDGVKYEVFLTRSIKARKIIFTFKKGALYVTYPKILKVNKAIILNGIKEHGSVLIERELNRGKPYDDKGVYFLGEYIPFKDGFVTVLGKTFLFLSLDNFYKRVKELALPIFEERTRHYEKLMNIKPPYTVRLRKKDTNYGVNSRKTHTITYNIFLLHYSIEIIDSVVVHELAHYFEFNHSQRFYNHVYKTMPNYDMVQAKLKKRVYKWLKKLKAKTINW